MTEHPSATLLRQGYDAFAKLDMAALTALFDENVVWHNPGNNIISGDYTGRDAVFAMFARTLELNRGTGSFEVHDVVANNEHAVSLLRADVSRPDVGKRLSVKEIHVFHLRDGKISEAWVFSENQRLNDDFWS